MAVADGIRRRNGASQREDGHPMRDRIEQLREQRRRARAEFAAAGKTRGAALSTATPKAAREWKADAEAARKEADKARSMMDDLLSALEADADAATPRRRRFGLL